MYCQSNLDILTCRTPAKRDVKPKGFSITILITKDNIINYACAVATAAVAIPIVAVTTGVVLLKKKRAERLIKAAYMGLKAKLLIKTGLAGYGMFDDY